MSEIIDHVVLGSCRFAGTNPEVIISKVRDFPFFPFLVVFSMSEIIDCIVFGSCPFLPGSCRFLPGSCRFAFKKRGKNETPLGISFLVAFLKQGHAKALKACIC